MGYNLHLVQDTVSLVCEVSKIERYPLMYGVTYDVLKAPASLYGLQSLQDMVMTKRSLPDVGERLGLRCKLLQNGEISVRCVLRVLEGGNYVR